MRSRLPFLLSCILATPLLAQPLPRPKPEPIKPTGAEVDPPKPAGPQLQQDSIPGLDDSDFRSAASPLRSEGTFLVDLRGSMLRLPTGERIIIFYTNDRGQRERPMVLIPCQALQQMEQMAADRPEVATFIITGQVFVYLSVNYLQPTTVRIVSAPAPTPDKPAEPEKPSTSDPAVQDLIRQLEAQREAPRGPERATEPAAKPDADASLLPEGRAVARRRGRLVRISGGDWAFTFDNGPEGEARLDRPMTLTPCLNLQRMESWAMQQGEAANFEVSGRTLVYDNRNYLIPTLFQVYPPNDLEARH